MEEADEQMPSEDEQELSQDDGLPADEGEPVVEQVDEKRQASPSEPNSPLLVPSEKKKDSADEPVDSNQTDSTSVNADMILEALEDLEHKHLRGASVDQILSFLLLKYPVNRDQTALRVELAACLGEAVRLGLIQLNQNGSYRLSSYLEETNAREGDPPAPPAASAPIAPKRSGSGGSRTPQPPLGQKRVRPSSPCGSGSSSRSASQNSSDLDPTWRPSGTPNKKRGRSSASKKPSAGESKSPRRSSRLRQKAQRHSPPASRTPTRGRGRRASNSRPRTPRSRKPPARSPRRRQPPTKRRRR